ncbi:NmrA/HSCARG family protein [Geminicoccus harenae]|uniref:NmrA/HSCARG family protein n=1 Tax=Geminicoccus harenae TaxID=2498453 RepID=UPI00168A8687|nr:NmrA/HSCARG family protein [Geminicoccus harenae]
MTILVTGSTGKIGSLVVDELSRRGAAIRALVHGRTTTEARPGVQQVQGDMMDVDAMQAALQGVDTLFLINAVVPDELTQALLTLDLAREAGVRRIVYFSVFNGSVFTAVSHFTGKYQVERMIEDADLPATILRPAYFFQNDVMLKDMIVGQGVYPMPIGEVGLNMVDARDIAEVAALELLRRENAEGPLPRCTISVVGPDRLTGSEVARIWSETLGREVASAGNDLDAAEAMFRQFSPAWSARDMRIMLDAFHRHGMVAGPETVPILETMLGRPLRTYRAFAQEMAKAWLQG